MCSLNYLLLKKPNNKILYIIKRKTSDYCPPTKCDLPQKRPMSVTVIGANSCVGRISAMLFKRHKIFRRLKIYDNKSTRELFLDLKTINRSPTVCGYSGIKQLDFALKRTRIIYICGGIQTHAGFSEQDLFDKNGPWVRQVITYCSEFNPDAHIVITTPPVSYLVPMCVEEFRKSGIDAEKRVYGLARHLVSRTNSIAGQFLKVVPESINGVVVGGTHRRTFIPIISHSGSSKDADTIIHRIQDAEDSVLRHKLRETNTTGCYLSIAYNGVKFTNRLARALEGGEKIMECAFVKQQDPMDKYAKYFSCMVSLDKDGIKSCHIPKMSDKEKDRLKKVINEIRNNIYLGSSYVTGDDMIVVRIPPEKAEEKKDEKQEKKKIEKQEKKHDDDDCPQRIKRPLKKITVKVQ